MKKLIALLILVFLTACQKTKLEDDVRYTRLATVVSIYEFSETERKQANLLPLASVSALALALALGLASELAAALAA